jgi:site-specific recombinase XerD
MAVNNHVVLCFSLIKNNYSLSRHDEFSMTASAHSIERVRSVVLSLQEIEAIIDAPNPASWIGQRDRVMLATLYATGARAGELVEMRVMDVWLDSQAHVGIVDKFGRGRVVPLTAETAKSLKVWLERYPRKREDLLFAARSGKSLSAALAHAVVRARAYCPRIRKIRINPH